MKRGERITSKTKSAIKNALFELIREKNYPEITVSEITQRGDVGRSTLYKHYHSKADVLVDIHKDMFGHLFSSLSTSTAWFAPQPPLELIEFLEKYRRLGRNPFSLSYKLGSDLDYLITNINLQLAATVLEKLHSAYNKEQGRIPLPMLAESISNLYSGLIMYWFNRSQSSDAAMYATHLHKMARALVVEAMGKNTA